MSHTPGPWTAEVVGVTTIENPEDICDITNGYKLIAESVRDRDANLIAAAPDLLAIVKALVPSTPDHATDQHYRGPKWSAIQAAIAKAEGK